MDLLYASKATKWVSYHRSIRFNNAIQLSTQHFLACHIHLRYLCCYLFSSSQETAPVATHLSAISYFHKFHSLPDPTKSFLVHQVQIGGRRFHHQIDTRHPITKYILHQLYLAIPDLSPNLI